MKMAAKFLVLFFLICLIFPVSAFAQDEPALELRLSRDNGYGLGNQMQGNFSYRVSGPDNLVRVEYLMDGEVIAESTSEPFRYSFVTDDFELGLHEMSAVGYTDDDQRLESNIIRGDFVSPQVTSRFIYVVLGLVVVSIGARFLFFRNSSGTTKKGYGALGGAVCSNCGRPFARNWWALNLVATRVDRCPHCGKWQGTRPATAEQLAKAEKFEDSLSGIPNRPDSEMDAKEKLRKQLDDSRFEDM
jgi:hypothetical protein